MPSATATKRSVYTGELLAVGSGVRLERDVVARDDYGRLLAYVYRASDGAFVNYEIVRHGFAQPLTIAPNTTFAESVRRRRPLRRAATTSGCGRRAWPIVAECVCHSVGVLDLRHRFPAVTEGNYQGWARFDGPAGTQVVDSAIEATAAWQRSGNNANSHGQFAAAEACDALVADVQRTLGRLLGADPGGFVFGPSTTANVFSLSRAIGRDLRPGDEIICTRLDHDSNVSPWLQVADDTGAQVRLVEFDVDAGRLPVTAIADALTDRTRWVAVTGASNAVGTMPDITAITAAAHAAGAKVVIDGVHLTPHAPVDLAAIGCDVYSTSSYKWYGPHAGITWIEPCAARPAAGLQGAAGARCRPRASSCSARRRTRASPRSAPPPSSC